MALHSRHVHRRSSFDPWVTRGEDIDYVINVRMHGGDVFIDDEWKALHLPPEPVSEALRFRQDVYRFVYEHRKIEFAKSQVDLRQVTPKSMAPYPGRLHRLVGGLARVRDRAAAGDRASREERATSKRRLHAVRDAERLRARELPELLRVPAPLADHDGAPLGRRRALQRCSPASAGWTVPPSPAASRWCRRRVGSPWASGSLAAAIGFVSGVLSGRVRHRRRHRHDARDPAAARRPRAGRRGHSAAGHHPECDDRRALVSPERPCRRARRADTRARPARLTAVAGAILATRSAARSVLVGTAALILYVAVDTILQVLQERRRQAGAGAAATGCGGRLGRTADAESLRPLRRHWLSRRSWGSVRSPGSTRASSAWAAGSCSCRC